MKPTKSQVTINKAEKICKISNKDFSWFMEVDGKSIAFMNYENALYFKGHYMELGYTIIFQDQP